MADYTTTPASITFSHDADFERARLAGAALAVGDIVHVVLGRWEKAQADSLANAGSTGKIGIVAAAPAADGQPCIVCTRDPALKAGFVLTMGTAVALSAAAAGKMAPASDISANEASVLLGWPISRNGTANHEDNKIYFSPIVADVLA